MNTILVLNAGSNSLKYSLFRGEIELLRGHIDGVGKLGTSSITFNKQTRTVEHYTKDHLDAVQFALQVIKGHADVTQIKHVLHRVVHGGEKHVQHTVIDGRVEKDIEELVLLAPLHNPANLAGIKAARQELPAATHVAFFDTAFHHTIPRHVFLYGIPYKFYQKWGIRKYGFHGLSHQYIAETVYSKTGSDERIVSCHLGSGSSITAIHRGKSLDTSMGFTPLDGLLMATRGGEMDPDIPLFLMEHEHLSFHEVNEMLNKESGLKGLVGTADLREVKRKADAGDQFAQLVIEMLSYRIATTVGRFQVPVGGMKTLTFTGGVGEHASFVRAEVCRLLAPFGVQLDEEANTAGREVISAPGSTVRVLLVPANEELQMVRLLQRGQYQRV